MGGTVDRQLSTVNWLVGGSESVAIIRWEKKREGAAQPHPLRPMRIFDPQRVVILAAPEKVEM